MISIFTTSISIVLTVIRGRILRVLTVIRVIILRVLTVIRGRILRVLTVIRGRLTEILSLRTLILTEILSLRTLISSLFIINNSSIEVEVESLIQTPNTQSISELSDSEFLELSESEPRNHLRIIILIITTPTNLQNVDSAS